MDHKPVELHLTMGGGGGMSPEFSLEVSRNGLFYEKIPPHGRGGLHGARVAEHIAISDEQWASFRARIDSLEIWRWKSEYPNPGVLDGTRWTLEIAYADRTCRSGGRNGYPKTFPQFMEAIGTLIGNREFW